MKYRNLITVLFLLPVYAIAQVKVNRTTPATINSILPFYSTSLLSNSQVVTFPFTRPTITQGGVPTNLNIDSTYDDLDDTTYETKPIFDFGRAIISNLTISSGNWQTSGSAKIWTLKIVINNALNTSLQFSSLTLSPTANLYILNGDTNMIKGPYTKTVLPANGIMGTFPMNGKSCYIIIQESTVSNQSKNVLTISSVVAGVQTLNDDLPVSNPAARPSNSCVPSIRCYNNWMNTASAVSRWSNGGGSACSGTLVNNENFDGTSYYYSAQHCLPGNITDLRFASFQFQFWQTGCNTNVDVPWLEFFGGATLLHTVAWNDGDAILLRLNSGPGVGDNVVYAGWSRQNNNPSATQSAIIHHPEAGDMRFTQTKKVRDFLWDSDFWKARYSTGVVRPGSSGSALFNENQQVIGTLSRGTSSCFWTFLGDRYGKFHRGWSGMQQFLSPNQNQFSIGALPLNPLTISGSASFGCISANQQFSVPNLVGCTFNWTTSANFTISSGQGTNRVQVLYNGTLATDAGWLNLVINDSKGTIPTGRRYETRLTLSKIQASNLTGYYTNNIDATQTQMIDGGTKYFNVQRGQFVSVNFNVTSTTNISALRWSCDNTIGSGNTFSMGWNAPQTGYTTLNKVVYLDATTPCGITRYGYYINIMSLGWSYRIAASPNPATGTINLAIDKVTDTTSTLKASQSSATQNNNSKGLTRILLYDANFTTLIKKWEYNEIETKNYQLNISGVANGVYVLKVERDNSTISSTIIVN